MVACDVRGRRIDLLRRTVAASGASNIRIVQADLLQPLPFSSGFDVVLVDAPCSGLGTLRRDPDIRWRRHPRDLTAFAEAQRAMLSNAADVVAPGGRLVYATCSSEPEENEEVVAAFLAEHAGVRGGGRTKRRAGTAAGGRHRSRPSADAAARARAGGVLRRRFPTDVSRADARRD